MMKKIFLYFITILMPGVQLYAQVVINQSDMPKPGDTLRVSVTNVVQAGYAKTAMDTAWNFATLEALGQRVDTFETITATPIAYQYFFVTLGGANLASPRAANLIPGVPLTNGFSFFKNNAAEYSDLGSAYTLQGLPIPAKYDNPDKYYEFPMPPGKTWSSTALFSITVPELISYTTQRIRSNLVDGWGALTTPFGTFQTVRVKSILNIHDSIYIDSLASGFSFNRNITEYKWLGKGQGVPLLQVNEEGAQATAIYRDVYRMSAAPLSVTLGSDTAVPKGTILTLHATVKHGTPPYQIFWNTLATGDSITITVQNDQTYSVIVVDALQNIGNAQKVVSVRYPPGIAEFQRNVLHAEPNPTCGPVQIKVPEASCEATLQVLTVQGKKAMESVVHVSSGLLNTNLTALPNGIYFIRITTTNKLYTGKIQVIK